MKKVLLLSLVMLVLSASPAYGSPHGEEADGCDHGATSKPCRPDPQPEHGKDCLVHGQHGGVNEDHCLPTTTTTTTVPSVPSTTTTTTRATTPPGTTTPTTPPGIPISTPTTPTTPTTTVTSGPSSPSPTVPEVPVELAFGGFGSRTLAFLGLWFLIGGLVGLGLGKVLKRSGR